MSIFSRVIQSGFQIPNFQDSMQKFENSNCLMLDGKRLAQNLKEQAKNLVSSAKVIPKLAVILIGEDPASFVYVNNKVKNFREVGFESQSYVYKSDEISEDELVNLIQTLNQSSGVHGILVQLPLPPQFRQERILKSISPMKDVDGFLPQNMGALACGHFQQPIACTPLGIMALLQAYGIPVAGKHVVVMGRSNIVGKPMSLLLLAADATVTIVHSRTTNVKEITKQADILVVAIGQKEFVTKEFVQPGAVVVDVGIHRNEDGKLAGDVHNSVKEVAVAMTPVPGGVGPMTISMLMVNTALAAWVD